MVQRLKWPFIQSKYILQKKDKNNLTNGQFSKNYVGLISLSQLRKRSSKGNTLIDHKKIKKIQKA